MASQGNWFSSTLPSGNATSAEGMDGMKLKCDGSSSNNNTSDRCASHPMQHVAVSSTDWVSSAMPSGDATRTARENETGLQKPRHNGRSAGGRNQGSIKDVSPRVATHSKFSYSACRSCYAVEFQLS